MIVGIGIDVCSVARFDAMLDRHPGIVERLFNPGERISHGLPRSSRSLSARFAAKEALAKAFGAPGNLSWIDAEVVADENGQPSMTMRGSVARRASELGVTAVHLSLSHDGGIATAIVIAEQESAPGTAADPVIGGVA
jgi:holo-[acyl-carrier protein] synthase